ncbi:hypothetical protein CYY_004203 [Polysphondylium violaceum]|uniref:Uncharacterized protein n=1 Tax=Polysphondylium violaceum TaxID=133409 RepID=A0A8J4PUZ6_9MYCE|nr:hypothetical protein CYY_004203 [Polysphondylium violaceum]
MSALFNNIRSKLHFPILSNVINTNKLIVTLFKSVSLSIYRPMVFLVRNQNSLKTFLVYNNDQGFANSAQYEKYVQQAANLIKDGKLSEAMVICEKAIALVPNHPSGAAYALGAEIHVLNQQYDFANSFYQKEITFNKTSEHGYYCLALLYFIQKKYTLSTMLFNHILKMNSNSYSILSWVDILKSKIGKMETSFDQFKTLYDDTYNLNETNYIVDQDAIIKVYKFFIDMYQKKTEVSSLTKDTTFSRYILQQGLFQAKFNLTYSCARTLQIHGFVCESHDFYKQSLQLDPTNDLVQNDLSTLNRFLSNK